MVLVVALIDLKDPNPRLKRTVRGENATMLLLASLLHPLRHFPTEALIVMMIVLGVMSEMAPVDHLLVVGTVDFQPKCVRIKTR